MNGSRGCCRGCVAALSVAAVMVLQSPAPQSPHGIALAMPGSLDWLGGGGDGVVAPVTPAPLQAPGLFSFFPQGATLWQDLPVTNFVDLDPTPGINAFDCTPRAYDGHNGHDAVIVGFSEQAIGVPVFAALDGTVIDRSDGNPDMNTTPTGQPDNRVFIDHGGGLVTRYHHMKNGSVAVTLGQSVTAGQQIGLTASSGNSGWPHLHFGTYQNGVLFESNAGPCRAGASNWVNQVPVPSDMRLTSFTFGTDFFNHSNRALPFDQVTRRGTFVQSAAFQGVYWRYSFMNLPANAVPTFTFKRPDGTQADTFNGTLNPAAVRWAQHTWGRNIVLNITGTWTLEFWVNGVLVARAPFTVVASAPQMVNRAPLMTSVALDPMFPGPADVPFCRVTPWAVHRADPDYDVVRYRYVWRVNGAVVRDVVSAGLGDALPKGSVQDEDTVTCTVTPNDGQVDGPTSTTSNLAETNLLQNADFSSGTTGWALFSTPDQSYIQSQITGGVLEFYRNPPPPGTANQAVVFQETQTSLRAGARIGARFRLGNSSSVRKRISVLIHDIDFTDLSVCTFWLPANLPLTHYEMVTHTTKPMGHATISFYAATHSSNGGFYQLDDVVLEFQAAGAANLTDCVDPLRPTPPGGVEGPELLANGNFASGALAPGWGTFGVITTQVTGGVLEFIRPAGAPAGVVLQKLNAPPVPFAAGDIMTATFQLGNSSTVRKRVTVLLHEEQFGDLHACTFWLAPGQPVQDYAMRTYATQAWAIPTISFYPSNVGLEQWTRLDNVSLKRTPGAPLSGSGCYEPGAVLPSAAPPPGMAGVVSRANWIPVGFEDVLTGGDTAWKVDAGARRVAGLLFDGPIDLRGASDAMVTVDSLFLARGAAAAVQVSEDGVTWDTIQDVPESREWASLVVDLSAHAGRVVYMRFLYDAGSAPASDSVWWLRNVRVR